MCTGPDFYDEFGPFFVAEAGVYTLSATWQGTADLDLIIFDSDCITDLAVGDAAVGDATSDSPPELIEVMLSADREFYIGIAAWNTYGSAISCTISEGTPGGG